jgi:hypothetical protein
VQLRVLERDPGGRGHRVQELRVLAQRGIVHERGQLPPTSIDDSHRSRAALDQLQAPPVQIDEGVVLANPIREDERWVSQRAGQRVAEIPRGWVVLELG